MARKPLRFEQNPLLAGPSLEARSKLGSPYRELNIADIDADPSQPRRSFDAEALAELAASIKEYGVLSPILVRVTEGGSYRVVAGERRFRASKLLGKTTIPAIIDSSDDDGATLAKQLVENLQRQDLSPVERAEAVGRLKEDGKLSIRDLATKLGVSKSAVQRSLDILELPDDLRAALADGASESKVLLLAQVTDRAKRQALLKRLDGLTRDQLEEELGRGPGEGKKSKKTEVSHGGTDQRLTPEDRRIVEELQKALGMKVQLLRRDDGKAHGKLVVDFYSREDLGELYRRLLK